MLRTFRKLVLWTMVIAPVCVAQTGSLERGRLTIWLVRPATAAEKGHLDALRVAAHVGPPKTIVCSFFGRRLFRLAFVSLRISPLKTFVPWWLTE